jgi:hypothetical protein
MPNRSNEECIAIVTDKKVRHLPAIEDRNLIRIISIGDLVHFTISHQKFTIEQLEFYIKSLYSFLLSAWHDLKAWVKVDRGRRELPHE